MAFLLSFTAEAIGNGSSMHFDAIIFDCDGTLVDSERLGNQVLVDCAAEVGVEMTLDEALNRFVGGKMADAVAHIQSLSERDLPADFTAMARERMAKAFREHLQAMPGATRCCGNWTGLIAWHRAARGTRSNTA